MVGAYDTKWLYMFLIMSMAVFAFKNHGNYFAEKSTAFQKPTDFLSDSNGIRTHNHLVRKLTLNHLAKLAI